MNIYRARESSKHPEGKQDLGRLLSRRRFLVLYEHKLADLVAFRAAAVALRILCGEHDLTRRNMRRNVARNFANGCTAMIILVPNEPARAAARRLLQREFPRSIWTRIGILTHAACRNRLAVTDNLTGVMATPDSQIVNLAPVTDVSGIPGQPARHPNVRLLTNNNKNN